MFLRGTLDKIGAYPDFLHIGEYKTAPNQLTEKTFTPAHREMAESLNADLYEQLIRGVADGAEAATRTNFEAALKTLETIASVEEVLEAAGPCGVAFHADAVLFLLRSMKTIMERVKDFGGGTLVAGRGLPRETGDRCIARATNRTF